MLVAGLCLVGLVGRLAYIHTAMRPRLLRQLEKQQRATYPIPARRGEILDSVGRVLAGSEEEFSIFADPTEVEDAAYVAAKIAPILETRADKLIPLLDHPLIPRTGEPRRFVWLKRQAHRSQIEALQALLKDDERVTGIDFIPEPVRQYPMKTVACHVLGFVDIDQIGREGVERRYESVLAGHEGSRTVYRDAGRKSIWQDPDAYRPPKDGMSVQLTIDAAIQEIVEDQIAAAAKHFQAESVIGVVMDPRTGDVLAMANTPTFDPNSPGNPSDGSHRNRAIMDPYEPGSVFKPFVASGALAAHVVKHGEIINCKGGTYTIGTRRLHDHHPYGDLTFEHIVIRSSNIGMALLGERLGNERMHRYLDGFQGFGFGAKTGIELDGEDPGMLLPLRTWTSYSTNSVPMGQEVSVTALQLAQALSAIVNGGTLVRPRIVRAIVDPRGHVVEAFREPQVVRRVIPEDVAEYMAKTVLVGVVAEKEGTGRRAQLDQWQVLGKTGTAQIARRGGGGYLPDAYTGSFIASAPASDPRVVVVVSVRKPNARIGYYGGTVAAPAAREILRRVLPYLGVPPDRGVDTPGVPDLPGTIRSAQAD